MLIEEAVFHSAISIQQSALSATDLPGADGDLTPAGQES
jgi:hypothetical protein